MKVLYERFKAGDSTEFMARDYRITKKQIQSTIDYAEGR